MEGYTIGGVAVTDLIKEYGSPLYVMDETVIRDNCRRFKNAVGKYFENGLVVHASKAFCCKEMCRIAMQEGLGLDVVSGGELSTALSVDFPTDKIFFHGSNKTVAELELAVNNNVGRIVLDNYTEIDNLNDICTKLGKKAKVLMRVNPGVEAHTHEFIRTGQVDSKFGISIQTGEALAACEYIHGLANIELTGIHCHIGSQIFDQEPFETAAEIMLGFIQQLNQKGISVSELNLGGGYGVKYLPGDAPAPFEAFVEKIAHVVKCSGITGLTVILEPGRSLTATAGITAYTVGAIKKIPGIRTYVSVDGGMTDNPRYIMYHAQYDALIAERPEAPREEFFTIAGKCCESGDILIKDIKMPKINIGDHLVVLSTGAYNYSMSSNYNRTPRPPVIMVSNGVSRVVVRRETYEDLMQKDI